MPRRLKQFVTPSELSHRINLSRETVEPFFKEKARLRMLSTTIKAEYTGEFFRNFEIKLSHEAKEYDKQLDEVIEWQRRKIIDGV